MEVARSGGWRNRLVTEQVYPEEDILRVLEDEETWLLRHKMEDKAIMSLKGWKWKGEGKVGKSMGCHNDIPKEDMAVEAIAEGLLHQQPGKRDGTLKRRVSSMWNTPGNS
ncbi:hypothetical protein R1sor_004584 [Riccia sorocarpa]|uniref:Uncharacterized protein n=1 Tax=Riccia sorocarpa TaxID=122646 RepID=A0ABD3HH36_9MARC